ncbi:hypothetical protein [Thermococcus sp.]|uniref:hypothetical protein n=1 Tax=Thermococcus sp. TaxID=35749 RepID=UPI002622DD58|nr:hypothetical protein [Thermococcus sp.]
MKLVITIADELDEWFSKMSFKIEKDGKTILNDEMTNWDNSAFEEWLVDMFVEVLKNLKEVDEWAFKKALQRFVGGDGQ